MKKRIGGITHAGNCSEAFTVQQLWRAHGRCVRALPGARGHCIRGLAADLWRPGALHPPDGALSAAPRRAQGQPGRDPVAQLPGVDHCRVCALSARRYCGQDQLAAHAAGAGAHARAQSGVGRLSQGGEAGVGRGARAAVRGQRTPDPAGAGRRPLGAVRARQRRAGHAAGRAGLARRCRLPPAHEWHDGGAEVRRLHARRHAPRDREHAAGLSLPGRAAVSVHCAVVPLGRHRCAPVACDRRHDGAQGSFRA